ncbi:Glycosyl transferase family 2 [Paracoccus isoporae]|uniref:Glycosyl transferase family 2 n=1 Tax=Paracoccus isoporae TaxID=591205 RepID=A0A1G6W2Z4_9RHOB|nr:glycosyltransferase family 2 protein [Paracoccus isoporae]SDD59415.1 Glycosyl transferase family 2 [Paracoccus isoporae]
MSTKPSETSSRKLLIAIMRDEGPYILEWVAHHRAIGFTDMIVFSNDCQDGSNLMLDRLHERGLLRHLPNPKAVFSQLANWQVSALRYASSFWEFRHADWVCTVDADEFIEISAGDGTLDALISACHFDLMSFPVLGYRSDQNPEIGDGRVQGRFTLPRRDISADTVWEPAGMAVKTLSRPRIRGAHFRNHRPKISDFSQTGMIWVGGAGERMPVEFTDHKINAWTFAERPTLAHVNHHSLRSRDSFLVKSLRGDAVTRDRIGLDTEKQIRNAVKYWNTRNHSIGTPREVHRPPRAAEIERDLHADPVLGELHQAACDHQRDTAKRLLATPAGERLASEMKL